MLTLFIVLGITAFTAENFDPFFVEGEGFAGTVTAASLIFFAYIGFDAVSTSGEEVKEPSRDLPRAIIGSLAIATTLYIIVAVVATGALPFDQLKGAEAPLATVLEDGAGLSLGADIIVQLVNIGTLFAFVVVNIGVIILRRTRPDLERGYRVPFVPVFPLIGTALCIYLMLDLPRVTWERFLIWMAIGLVIYFAYGIRHSRLRQGRVTNPEADL